MSIVDEWRQELVDAFRRSEEQRARRVAREYERRLAAGDDDADDVFDAPAPRT